MGTESQALLWTPALEVVCIWSLLVWLLPISPAHLVLKYFMHWVPHSMLSQTSAAPLPTRFPARLRSGPLSLEGPRIRPFRP